MARLTRKVRHAALDLRPLELPSLHQWFSLLRLEAEMVWHIARSEALADPLAARLKVIAKLRRLAELDDPEANVIQILVDAIMLVESYRGARHQITFLPELTRSVDALLREFEVMERAEKLAAQ